MKRRKVAIGLVLFLTILTACSKITGKNGKDQENIVTTSQVGKSEVENPSWDTPTVFFHGYKGTKGSFKGMMSRLSKNQGAHLGEILEVSPEGEVRVQKDYGLDKKKLLIQVLFVDNQNNDINQAQWIANTFEFLKAQGITKVNLVGHSMGGVSGLRYLLTIPLKDNFSVEKFISMGAPFDGFEELAKGETMEDVLEKGPQNKDLRYVNYIDGLNKFPKNLPWLNIAGLLDENDPNKGDESVPLPSSLALSAAAKKQGLNYKNQIFKAQHSELHDNEEVDEFLGKFLWGEN